MRKAAYSGLGISLLGAALDFGSGYSLGPMATAGTMGGAPSSSAIGMYLLGIAVLIVGVLTVLPRTGGSMRRLGLAMELFGVVMALASAWVPEMNVALSYAMIPVGAAMILNGAVMQRTKKSMEGG